MKKPTRYLSENYASSRVFKNKRVSIIKNESSFEIQILNFIGKIPDQYFTCECFMHRGTGVTNINISDESMEELILLYKELKKQKLK